MAVMECDILRREQEAVEMSRAGFIPVWLKDLADGMYVAVPVGSYNNRHWAYGVVREPIRYGEIVQWFVLTDDGIHHTCAYNISSAIWVNVEKSEHTPDPTKRVIVPKMVDPELERLLAEEEMIEREARLRNKKDLEDYLEF